MQIKIVFHQWKYFKIERVKTQSRNQSKVRRNAVCSIWRAQRGLSDKDCDLHSLIVGWMLSDDSNLTARLSWLTAIGGVERRDLVADVDSVERRLGGRQRGRWRYVTASASSTRWPRCHQLAHLQHFQVLDELLRWHALALEDVHLCFLTRPTVVRHCEHQNVVVQLHRVARRERCWLLDQRRWKSLHYDLKR